MIDIQFVRENPELAAEKSKQKGAEVDIPKLLLLDSDRRELLSRVEELRRQRNENASKMKGGKPEQSLIDEGKQIKMELSKQEEYLESVEKEWAGLLRSVPNMPLDNVPVGSSEDENQTVKEVGDKPEFDFEPRDDEALGMLNEFLDKQRAAKVTGSRFAYVKGNMVKLQMALMQWVIDVLTDEDTLKQIASQAGLGVNTKPFTPILPPLMLRTKPYELSGRLNAEEVTYKIEQDDLWLNASAEHPLCAMYMDEILDESALPIRYIGYATSFRREAGTYGKDTEGLFRMHQFDKLEMEVFSTKETGESEHKFLIAIQEYLVTQLGLSYHLVQKCTADIGKPNASGYDIDCWMPAQGRYRETHTADYMTDYQARGLNIRVKRDNGELEFVHTNDATAFALGRIMKAILENYQDREGRITIPEILRGYIGGVDRL